MFKYKNASENVDIIIPNYNKGIYLKDCISSVIKQTYKNWFLYIIDDCSIDNSLQILDSFKKIDNIKIIKLNKNMGPSFCRNLGIRNSKSKFISFLDSDDYWTDNKLQDQINFMIKNKYNFTYTDYITIFESKNNKKIKTNIKDSFTFEEFVRNSSINSSTMIIERKLINNKKFKKINLLEDYLFKCEILKNNNKAYKLNKESAFYRVIKNSRSKDILKNLYFLWIINKQFNKMSFVDNIYSIFSISINSLKKYKLNKF